MSFMRPVYNQLLDNGGSVIPYPVPRMIGMGTQKNWIFS